MVVVRELVVVRSIAYNIFYKGFRFEVSNLKWCPKLYKLHYYKSNQKIMFPKERKRRWKR
jgi:hypothetical protein